MGRSRESRLWLMDVKFELELEPEPELDMLELIYDLFECANCCLGQRCPAAICSDTSV